MNDSQSSDFLSESTDIFCNSPQDPTKMDIESYDSLLANTKAACSSVRKTLNSPNFSAYFSTFLEDCSSCITQSLDLIIELLSETNINTNKLTDYINNAVNILQLLSDLVKNIIETVSMSCITMKTFPTTTGRIINMVFAHCKDSESLYGSNLNKVEKQLKDLFRTCHELQLTYLILLEKHFIFDLTETQEQNILIEALDIILKIGEIVQSLDVKTMAEQWKAFTMICEKHSNYLLDKHVFLDCSKVLCAMITNNIQNALEENQEDKMVLRSLKISSFALKILTRVCSTFKHAVVKDHSVIIELLLCIHLNNQAYLQTIRNKPLQIINQYNSNVISATNSLLSELLLDEKFVNHLCYYDLTIIIKDERLLGYIILITSIMGVILKQYEDFYQMQKHRLISAIFSVLRYGHVWFNMGLKFDCSTQCSYKIYGLYEHLLVNTTALAVTMYSEDVQFLEQKMIETLLSVDCCSAMFTSNLWMTLARISPSRFLLSQVISLCKIYQSLEKHKSFLQSPSKVHLTHTINSLFNILSDEEKLKVYNTFSMHDNCNIKIWICLEVKYLPNEVQFNAEHFVIQKFKNAIGNLSSNGNGLEVAELIDIINLASTCSTNIGNEIEEELVKAWMKSCPTKMRLTIRSLDNTNLWYYKYIEALAKLTGVMANIFSENGAHLAKILHIISNILQAGSQEFKLALINTLCKLAIVEIYDGNKRFVDAILMQSYRELFCDKDVIVRNKLFYVLNNHRTDMLDKIVTKVVAEENLHEIWSYFLKYGRLKRNQDIELKEQLFFTLDVNYCHKCIENGDIIGSGSVTLQKSLSNNFDFVDIDVLFDTESDTEPACKKAKINNSEVENIIFRLETDATLLSKIKENLSSVYEQRVKNIINKLNAVIK